MTATTKTPKIEVQTVYQKIILLNHMIGQISDGMWENASPTNHWQVFSGIRWEDVAVVEAPRGTIGFSTRRNYAFNNSELLSIIGDRINFDIKMYDAAGDKVKIEEYFSGVANGSLYRIESYEAYVSASKAPTSEYETKLHNAYKVLVAAGITDEIAKSCYREDKMDHKFMVAQCTQLQRLLNDKSEPNQVWKARHGVPANMTIADWNKKRRSSRK